MTATVDAASHSNGHYQEGDQVDSLFSNTPLDLDEDLTVRPNGFHLQEPVLGRSVQTSPVEPSNPPVLQIPPPLLTASISYDHERRPSSPQSSVTHTEITGGITDRSSRRRSIMDVRLVLLKNSPFDDACPAQ